MTGVGSAIRQAIRTASWVLVLLLVTAAAHTGAQAQQAPARTLPDFVSLVKQHGNAVVNINSTRTISGEASLPIPEDHPLYEYFKRFALPDDAEEYQAQGLGSGFIISTDGHILTNAHVVSESDEVTVRLTDKREFKARVIGADAVTDIALLKIDAKNLPAVKLGGTREVEAGEWVAAIGAPFGFDNSVTAGIVSAKGRLVPDESYVPFIQTDVAVNPGNSGGPLFDMNGEVIGINSMIYSRTGGFMGLSFAIPIDLAMDIARQLQATGKVTRSRIGVQAQELSRELAASFGLQQPVGALVAMVEEGGPADKAGLRPGDVVLSLGDQEVEGPADLARFVAGTKPGTTVIARVWRMGKPVALKITTAEQMPTPGANGDAEDLPPSPAGLTVGEIPDEQRRLLKLEGGVLVHQTEGAAARAGIEPGDIILRVNNTTVKNVEHLQSLIAGNRGKSVALLIRRGADTVFVPLRLPPPDGAAAPP